MKSTDGLLAFLLVALTAVPVVVAHGNGICPYRTVTIIVGDGVLPGTIYRIDYPLDMTQPPPWYYAESGVRSGVQSGNNHVVLGSTWGHDHSCYWSEGAERDFLLY